ncbi:hypothetical protein CIL05_20730 [Virgibacillus profundi]|uniref:Uncharacterized protein n=1 Tax=Virgibacillus profundi TaxID=2024555 RepID=A0A2A2I964_9BACI|nr:hypothetical protein [Virgibacillus profundi]PAV27680.1 hypothetical protein CIL05_20730 [Virgibacillus profundi]PXY51835.1 hypothetical protein CIT14_20950 [Virgibacillus profundi]
MMRKKFYAIIALFMLSFFAVACSDDTSSEEPNEAEETEETEESEAEAEEASEPEEEEKAIPEDEDLFSVLETNIQTIVDQDTDAHMETIHSESPAYEGTEQNLEVLADYTLDMKLSDLTVEEKTEEEARVAYTQTSMKVEGPAYQNNQTKGVHILKPEDGIWKIFNTEVVETIPLDENGEVMEQGEAAMEGDYADLLLELEMPFDGDKWVLGNYQEAQGEAIAEFLVAGEEFENYTELLTLHYYENGNDSLGIAGYVDMMETNLGEMITGNLEFNRIEEGIYEFAVTEDEAQLDQQEIARVFVKDNDLYVVRYTTMEQTIEDRDGWVENLKGVQ